MNEPPITLHAVLINDDAAQLSLFAGLLRKIGCETHTFRSAGEALKVIGQDAPPDLLVTDLYMPGIDGWRFCRLVRSPEFPKLNQTPILVTSATYAGDEAARLSAELGANAFLTVPVSAAKFIETVRIILEGRTAARWARVLLVEDDAGLAALLSTGFSAYGYHVDSVRTGAEALSFCQAEPPDVIILDYHLPDTQGDKLLDEFHHRYPASAVIMITGDPQPDLALDWMRRGASGYARKPFHLEYLIQLCEGARRERALLRVEEILEQRTCELRDQEEKYRMVANFTLDWEYWMKPDGTFCYVSPSCKPITGYSPEDFYADARLLSRIIHPEDREVMLGHIEETRKRREPVRLQFRIVSRAGNVVWIEHRCQPVCREDGTYLGRRAGNSDITERKQAEEDLKKAQGELLQASRLAGMAEVATNILHNVGNVLNSVNVSASLLSDQLKRSKAANLSRASDLINLHSADLNQFLTVNPKGRQLPTYLAQLAEHLIQEQSVMAEELESLRKNVEHIKDIITVQQGYAKVLGVSEAVPTAEVLEDALRMSAESLQRHGVEVERDYDPALLPIITIEKHKILQILVNLISNAKYACVESKRPDKRLTLRVSCSDAWLRIAVMDNGVGIAPENLTRIFNHGFTTRKDGHGFGLHSSALAANDMGGSLRAQSEGLGKGTTFLLELPLLKPDDSSGSPSPTL